MTEAELKAWIQDLHSGMYINCVYCGHRYGPNTTEVPADALRRHVAECTEHPMAKLVQTCESVIAVTDARHGSRDSVTCWVQAVLTAAVEEVKK
jgi:hypothetical protein